MVAAVRRQGREAAVGAPTTAVQQRQQVQQRLGQQQRCREQQAGEVGGLHQQAVSRAAASSLPQQTQLQLLQRPAGRTPPAALATLLQL